MSEIAAAAANHLEFRNRQIHTGRHIPYLLLLYSLALSKSLSITRPATMKEIVAESLLVHVFEISFKYRITGIASQHCHSLFSFILMFDSVFTESRVLILLSFDSEKHLVFTSGL
jgi:hypothetical protein